MAATSPDPHGGTATASGLRAPEQRELLWGWGRTSPSAARVARPAMDAEMRHALDEPPPRGALARGLGRSYGDASLNAGGRVVDTTMLSSVALDTDPVTGEALVTASAGTSIDTLLRVLVPRGCFVPVTPGTRFVTVGGAVASDIHGKNHHVGGSWCDHVRSLRLLLPSGEVVEIGPDRDAELFWATAGGMGLTGVVVDVTFRCPRIESSRLLVDTDRARDLDEIMALMRDDTSEYSVAWIDLMATGRNLGRSVLTRGRFARLEELPAAARHDPLRFEPNLLVTVPPLVPDGLLGKASVRAFNEVWFRKAPAERRGELQSITSFFHPLDFVGAWNRLYGSPGFLQWQYVVPFGAEDVVRATVERLSASGCTSFLAVLKTFGPANPGPLSFPLAGWTLALDIPCGVAGLPDLLDGLDGVIAGAGGRVYLAKDSRLRPELVEVMYPRLAEWRATRERADPGGVLRSDLARRLRLC